VPAHASSAGSSMLPWSCRIIDVPHKDCCIIYILIHTCKARGSEQLSL
jgi:hypothetical protein